MNSKEDFSEEYPLGNMLEPFDIGRDKQLMEDFENSLIQQDEEEMDMMEDLSDDTEDI